MHKKKPDKRQAFLLVLQVHQHYLSNWISSGYRALQPVRLLPLPQWLLRVKPGQKEE